MEIRGDQTRVQAADSVRANPGLYQATSGGTGKSRVEVSSNAQQLADLHKLVSQASEVRPEKVQALKSKIDSGQYQVDLPKLADVLSKVL